MVRIYVASLSDYNAGVLHGRWVELTDAEAVRGEIETMLKDSPTAKAEGNVAEEWAVHDYEGFGSLRLSEYEGVDALCDLAEAVVEHGDAFLAWAANSTDNRDKSDFEDHYRGEFASLAEYAEGLWEDADLAAPEGVWWHPLNYVDWDRMGRDLELSGDVWSAPAPGGRVFIFSNS